MPSHTLNRRTKPIAEDGYAEDVDAEAEQETGVGEEIYTT